MLSIRTQIFVPDKFSGELARNWIPENPFSQMDLVEYVHIIFQGAFGSGEREGSYKKEQLDHLQLQITLSWEI